MFPCTSCGLCCQNISKIKNLKNYDLGNGICKYFNSIDNSCKIYNKRPDICSVDIMFKIKYKQYFTEKIFYMENAKSCNYLQKKYGLDISFKVNIE